MLKIPREINLVFFCGKCGGTLMSSSLVSTKWITSLIKRVRFIVSVPSHFPRHLAAPLLQTCWENGSFLFLISFIYELHLKFFFPVTGKPATWPGIRSQRKKRLETGDNIFCTLLCSLVFERQTIQVEQDLQLTLICAMVQSQHVTSLHRNTKALVQLSPNPTHARGAANGSFQRLRLIFVSADKHSGPHRAVQWSRLYSNLVLGDSSDLCRFPFCLHWGDREHFRNLLVLCGISDQADSNWAFTTACVPWKMFWVCQFPEQFAGLPLGKESQRTFAHLRPLGSPKFFGGNSPLGTVPKGLARQTDPVPKSSVRQSSESSSCIASVGSRCPISARSTSRLG